MEEWSKNRKKSSIWDHCILEELDASTIELVGMIRDVSAWRNYGLCFRFKLQWRSVDLFMNYLNPNNIN